MYFTRTEVGVRAWFAVATSTGSLRTGLLAASFTATVVTPADNVSATYTVVESVQKPGLYYFDIPASFFVSNGVGDYSVAVEVDTRAGGATPPHVITTFMDPMKVSENDFDSLASAILASTSTDHTQAVSGSVIYGTQVSGTYQSTHVRDNIYWQIQESAVDGITVEMVFNLPSVGHKPGVILAFGRYTGSPQVSHYQELWAWNYESSSWELLDETFMPGGQTSDDEHSRVYFERHVDRDNSNEVKIRIVHHITNYNSAHMLYLDYVEVSSFKVVTAGDVADAVWDETGADHLLAGSFGQMVQHILGLVQSNFRLYNTVHDANKNLTSASIRIYPSAADADANTNHLAEFAIVATYAGPGETTTYKMTKV